jgi:streptomycin 6-kinase
MTSCGSNPSAKATIACSTATSPLQSPGSRRMRSEEAGSAAPAQRLALHARAWEVDVDETFETATSIIAFGLRGTHAVTLKITKHHGDEWYSGQALHSFACPRMVRVLAFDDGAVLMDRIRPGTNLAELSLHGRDDEVMRILLDVIAAMPVVQASHFPAVEDWSGSFARYRATGNRRVAEDLVEEAEAIYKRLAASQREVRLLHGDLHGFNVLLDDSHGWLGIDPKGVVGEPEFELGAALRNPLDRPDIFASRPTIEARLRRISGSGLGLDMERVASWAFAQAVLSALWGFEDGSPAHADLSVLQLAETLRPMVG